MVRDFKIGQIVYHRDVYNHCEPLKIVGIIEFELELEGDYSGGTNNVCQKQWMPIKGVSTIYNYKYKKECREYAVSIKELARPILVRNQDTVLSTMFDLREMVFRLTNDITLNPECE
jgi:hypothetical protein